MAEMSPLRRRMIEDMTVRNLSPATQRSYLHAVSKFSRYFNRSPDRLGLEEVRAFQVHLVASGISWPGLNQTVCALRFFDGVTLGHGEIPERIPYAREPRKLPVVLNADEVVRFLEAVPSLKTRAALTTAYAAGLRASEAVGVKVADIDSGRMLIRVEDGKGGKDAQAPQGPRLARTAQALPFPLHPDLGLMARCRRGPLRQTDPAAAQVRGKGIVDLQAAINRFLAETNQNPKPFTWIADPDAIIDKGTTRETGVRVDPLACANERPGYRGE